MATIAPSLSAADLSDVIRELDSLGVSEIGAAIATDQYTPEQRLNLARAVAIDLIRKRMESCTAHVESGENCSDAICSVVTAGSPQSGAVDVVAVSVLLKDKDPLIRNAQPVELENFALDWQVPLSAIEQRKRLLDSL